MKKDEELLEAARKGNLIVVEKLLTASRSSTRSIAASFGIKVGPNVNCQDLSGYTPIHHAALNGHRAVVTYLLRNAASVNTSDIKGSYPLHLAAWSGHHDIVNILLTHGPSVAKVNEKNGDSETALHCASQHGHTQTVQVLLKNGADPSVRNIRNESPLDLASQYGRLDVVRLLLLHQPSLLKRHPDCFSPLHLASRNGHKEVVELLIAHGADVNRNGDNGTALHEAALFGKLDVVRLLLTRGANPHATDPQHRTPLELVKQLDTRTSRDISQLILSFTSGTLQPLSDPPEKRNIPEVTVEHFVATDGERKTSFPVSRSHTFKGFGGGWSRSSFGRASFSLRRSASARSSKSLPRLPSSRTPVPLSPDLSAAFRQHHPTSTMFPVSPTNPRKVEDLRRSSTSLPAPALSILSLPTAMSAEPVRRFTRQALKSEDDSVFFPLSRSKPNFPLSSSPNDQESSSASPTNMTSHTNRPKKPTRTKLSTVTSLSPPPIPPKPAEMMSSRKDRPPSPSHPPPSDDDDDFADEFKDDALVVKSRDVFHCDVSTEVNGIFPASQSDEPRNESHEKTPHPSSNLLCSVAPPVDGDQVNPKSVSGHASPTLPPPSPHSAMLEISSALQQAVSHECAQRDVEEVKADSKLPEVTTLPPSIVTSLHAPEMTALSTSKVTSLPTTEGTTSFLAAKFTSSLSEPEVEKLMLSSACGEGDVKPIQDTSSSRHATPCDVTSLPIHVSTDPPGPCEQVDPPLKPKPAPRMKPPIPIKPQIKPKPTNKCNPIETHSEQGGLGEPPLRPSNPASKAKADDSAIATSGHVDLVTSLNMKSSGVGDEVSDNPLANPAVPPYNLTGIPPFQDLTLVDAATSGDDTSTCEWNDDLSDRTEDLEMPKECRKFRGLIRGASYRSRSKSRYRALQRYDDSDEYGADSDDNAPTNHSAIHHEISPIHFATMTRDVAGQDSDRLKLSSRRSDGGDSPMTSSAEEGERPLGGAKTDDVSRAQLRSSFYDNKPHSRPSSDSRLPGLDVIKLTVAAVTSNKGSKSGSGSSASSTLGGAVPGEGKDEWAQIADVISGLGGGHNKGTVYAKEFQETFWQIMTGSNLPRQISTWLSELGLPQYQSVIAGNGFDDVDFLADDVLEERDLIDMDVTDASHRRRILDSAQNLPKLLRVHPLDPSHPPPSVGQWLASLHLPQYEAVFATEGYHTMAQVRDMTEQRIRQLVPRRGHAKRIAMSMRPTSARPPRKPSSPLAKSSPPLSRSPLLESVNFFKDYNNIVNSRPAATAAAGSEEDIDSSPPLSPGDKLPDSRRLSSSSPEVDRPRRRRSSRGHVPGSERRTVTSSSKESTPTRHLSELSVFIDNSSVNHQRSPPGADGENRKMSSGEPPVASLPDSQRATFLASSSNGGDGPGLNLRPPNETTREVSVSAWRHPPEVLINSCCNYQAYYLGSMLIRELKGVESTMEACTKMRRSTDAMKKIPTITLSVNYRGVKFIDFKSKHELAEHEIQNISFASQDADDLATFAYITHDVKTGHHYCHVFRVTTMDMAYEVILTLGQAFEVAYQLILKENALKEST